MYQFESRIRFSETDAEGHLTIPGVINYFQDCSIFHSEAIGRGIAYQNQVRKGWVLSSWQILFDRLPELGEAVQISTWATEFAVMYGNRNFTLTTSAGEMLARAHSIWVYMDLAAGRPLRVDAAAAAAYGQETPLPGLNAPRKIKRAAEPIPGEPFAVQKHHIDTNHHVNNSQYVTMALEQLSAPGRIRQLRVDYRQAAVLGDMIYPQLSRESDRCIVELGNAAGKPYALIEMKENL